MPLEIFTAKQARPAVISATSLLRSYSKQHIRTPKVPALRALRIELCIAQRLDQSEHANEFDELRG